MAQLSKNFNSKEFDSPDEIDSGLLMDQKLINKLQMMRDYLGEAIIINSGYRTKRHNLKIGGSLTSSHLKGLAVDIRCDKPDYRFRLLEVAFLCQFTRIGIGKTFIHLDIDYSKSRHVMWLY